MRLFTVFFLSVLCGASSVFASVNDCPILKGTFQCPETYYAVARKFTINFIDDPVKGIRYYLITDGGNSQTLMPASDLGEHAVQYPIKYQNQCRRTANGNKELAWFMNVTTTQDYQSFQLDSNGDIVETGYNFDVVFGENPPPRTCTKI